MSDVLLHAADGRSVHVWNIELRREDGELSCVSRLTTSIIEVRGRA